MKKFTNLLFIFITCFSTLFAENEYLITKKSLSSGKTITFAGRTFTVGKNVFSSLNDINNLDAGSKIFCDAGDYTENVTISVPNITLLGSNAFGDERSNTRSNEESVIKGTLTVNADGLTINGFTFTENGCVVNNTATASAPVDGFNFVYNNVYGSSLKKSRSIAVVKLGTAFSGSDANNAEAHRRYKNINIAHNTFKGNKTANANFIVLSGSYGYTNICDNAFNDGGMSIILNNAQNDIDITNNSFKNVGGFDRTNGSTTGEFSIFLYYIAFSNSTLVNIKNNTFDACNGQSTLYAPIRFFQGDGNNPKLEPKNCRINLKYNTFQNISNPKDAPSSNTSFNYVFYANKNYTSPAIVDTRHNRFDNTEYCMGILQQPEGDSQERYFASSTELFDFATSKGTTLSYYLNPVGDEVKKLNLTGSNRVAQSFDIDDTTGDIYFVQICPNSQSGLKLKAQEPLMVTRYYKNSSGKMAQQKMYLDHAGHGSNMAVCRYKGTLYIATGGDSYDKNTTPANTSGVMSRACCVFPFVAGATADLATSSFTYKSKKYTINKFINKFGRNWQYPAIDRDNRLFCERSSKGNTIYFEVYDLDEVFTKWSDAEPINIIPVKKQTAPVYTSSNTDNNFPKLDKGFQTWPPQGFTISGDYIYHLEGVGRNTDGAASQNGKTIPTIMVHAFNWKTGKLGYRKPILKSTILNLDDGEPEGVKIHRDSEGRAHMIISLVSGKSGFRKANLFYYTLNSEKGLSRSIAKGEITTDASSINFTSSEGEAMQQTLSFTRSMQTGEPTFCISGNNADMFSLTCDKTGELITKNKLTVTYTPKNIEGSHNAKLRISSPNSADVIVNLNGKNNKPSSVSSIANNSPRLIVTTDKRIISTDETDIITIYNTLGQQITGRLNPDIYIVKATDISGKTFTHKIIIK